MKIQILFFRNNVSLKTLSDENSVVTDMVAPWNKTILPTLLSNYKLENIFNADEFGLFFQCGSTKTSHMSGEKILWKEKQHGLADRYGSCKHSWGKMAMVLIAKSIKPRCSNNLKQLPFQ